MKRESAEHVEIKIRAGDDDQPEAGEQRYNDRKERCWVLWRKTSMPAMRDTAAYDGQQQEISLRQAGDLLVAGLQLSQKLVQAIGQKRRSIDDQEPQPEESPFGARIVKIKPFFAVGSTTVLARRIMVIVHYLLFYDLGGLLPALCLQLKKGLAGISGQSILAEFSVLGKSYQFSGGLGSQSGVVVHQLDVGSQRIAAGDVLDLGQ